MRWAKRHRVEDSTPKQRGGHYHVALEERDHSGGVEPPRVVWPLWPTHHIPRPVVEAERRARLAELPRPDRLLGSLKAALRA